MCKREHTLESLQAECVRQFRQMCRRNGLPASAETILFDASTEGFEEYNATVELYSRMLAKHHEERLENARREVRRVLAANLREQRRFI